MTPEPTVTVVVPCFNHGRFVRAAVESCLRQEGADVRVVVVNDGSTDGTTGAACDACRSGRGGRGSEDRVTVIHQENRGLPAARNRGARLAEGEYLVFLDADDWLEPDFVRKLAARIEEERGAGGAGDPGGGGDVSHAYCQERLVELGTGIWRVPEWDPLLLLITNLHPVTTLVRRERFLEVGGFDESMRHGYEDWDLWLKFVERGWRGVRVAEPLFVWRRHSHTTMVMQVIQNHEALYRHIVANHADLYARHAVEIMVRANVLMRKFDVNWIDETGFPIPLQALWRVRDEYEALAAVRLNSALVRSINAMPRPLAAGARRTLGLAKRALAILRGGERPAPEP